MVDTFTTVDMSSINTNYTKNVTWDFEDVKKGMNSFWIKVNLLKG